MEDFKNDIIPQIESVSTVTNTVGANEGITLFNSLLSFVKESIFGLLAVIAIGAFIYIGFKLVKAEGNPEEMKKAFMNLIHVIVGLFIVAISWALVTMVSGITF